MTGLTTLTRLAFHSLSIWAPGVSGRHGRRLSQLSLFFLGVILLSTGIVLEGQAGTVFTGSGSFSMAGSGYGGDYEPEVNEENLKAAAQLIMQYIEGSFGALVMVCSGIGAILSSAFGQYRAALSCLVVAVGSFILRSVLNTFFPDVLGDE